MKTLSTQAMYIDSPVLAALNQVQPYYLSGIFNNTETTVFMRWNALIKIQGLFAKLPENLNILKVHTKNIGNLPVVKGGVQFYPFNSKSNFNAVANRDVFHVLTLHGESNKSASFKPAARIYDYVTIAGPLARDRYLQAGIFNQRDADNGRLVMMGDSFVQSMPYLRAASQQSQNPAVMYCPTWEGYGAKTNNYSSISEGFGFKAVESSARILNIKRICIKPHPYMGLLQPKILMAFTAGLRELSSKGFQVEILSSESNFFAQAAFKLLAPNIPNLSPSSDQPIDIALGICDISAMESVFLKQGIHHLTIGNLKYIPHQIHHFYKRKSLTSDENREAKLENYLTSADEIDAYHRAEVFGWHDSKLEAMSLADRNKWLIDYVQGDPFWSKKSKAQVE